jgi:hypothetical protein
MGPFEGKTGQNVNKSEVEIRPVSIDDSSCVHLGEKLVPRIFSPLLYQLSYPAKTIVPPMRNALSYFSV